MLLFQQQYSTGSSNNQFKDPCTNLYLPRTSNDPINKPKPETSNSDSQSKNKSHKKSDDEPEQSNSKNNDDLDESPFVNIEGVKLDPLASRNPQPPLIQGSIPKDTAISLTSTIYGLSPEKVERIKALYERLDLDSDGTINIRDLSKALQKEATHIPSNYAGRILQRISREDKHEINFQEFLKYVVDHERKLELIFKDLDRNQDGYIDIKEIKNYCNDLGIPLSDQKAQHIVERMDLTGSASIDLSEFQKFMLFFPSDRPEEIANFWRHNLAMLDF